MIYASLYMGQEHPSIHLHNGIRMPDLVLKEELRDVNSKAELGQLIKTHGVDLWGYKPSDCFKFKLNWEKRADGFKGSMRFHFNYASLGEAHLSQYLIDLISPHYLCNGSKPVIDVGFIETPEGGVRVLDMHKSKFYESISSLLSSHQLVGAGNRPVYLKLPEYLLTLEFQFFNLRIYSAGMSVVQACFSNKHILKELTPYL